MRACYRCYGTLPQMGRDSLIVLADRPPGAGVTYADRKTVLSYLACRQRSLPMVPLPRFLRLTSAVAVCAMAVQCSGGGDVTPPPSPGSLEITTSTSGPEPDADGYSVQIDDGDSRAIGAAATITATELSPGTHSVQIAGLASNCTLSGDNP